MCTYSAHSAQCSKRDCLSWVGWCLSISTRHTKVLGLELSVCQDRPTDRPTDQPTNRPKHVIALHTLIKMRPVIPLPTQHAAASRRHAGSVALARKQSPGISPTGPHDAGPVGEMPGRLGARSRSQTGPQLVTPVGELDPFANWTPRWRSKNLHRTRTGRSHTRTGRV